jgi:hypothetical protein
LPLLVPIEHLERLGVGDLSGRVIERGLREALLVDAQREQELVGDDGVVHAHAAFVEDTHDGLVHAKVVGDLLGDGAGLGRNRDLGERLDVGDLVLDDTGLQPALQAAEEQRVVEVLAPQRRVFDAGLGERAVEIEHADEARPGAGPVGHIEQGPAVRDQAGKEVMRILPDALGDNERCGGINPGEHSHALFLRGDEAMINILLEGVGADELVAKRGNNLGQLFFHGGLGRPAFFIGRLAEVAVGDQIDALLRQFFYGWHNGE